jgi:hypothetical protein
MGLEIIWKIGPKLGTVQIFCHIMLTHIFIKQMIVAWLISLIIILEKVPNIGILFDILIEIFIIYWIHILWISEKCLFKIKHNFSWFRVWNAVHT